MARVAGQVGRLVGVEHQVVELLLHHRQLGPSVAQHHVLADAVVAVGQRGNCALGEAADVLPPLGADHALRLVLAVVVDLREHRVVDLLRLAAHQRQQRAPLQPRRRRGLQQFAQGREQVYVRHQRIAHPAALETAGPRRISITPVPWSVRLHFMRGNGSRGRWCRLPVCSRPGRLRPGRRAPCRCRGRGR